MEEQKQEQVLAKELEKSKGFRGWLGLLAVGIIMNPIRLILAMTEEYTTMGFDVFSYIINIVLLIFSIWLVYLLFSRKKSFKKWFLALAIISLLIAGIDALIVMSDSSFFTVEEVSQTIANFIGTFLVAIIWPIYLWKSKRAKNTLINN